MAAPLYHLRPNKAVDRFLLIEALRRLVTDDELGDYTYYGFGGAYLEDFRVFHELCPKLRMVSIERELSVVRRQRFHRPCSHTRIVHDELSSFLAQKNFTERSVVWLDYTDLTFAQIQDFKTTLEKVTNDSIVKITLAAHPSKYSSTPTSKEAFREEFDPAWPAGYVHLPGTSEVLSELLMKILKIAAEQVLPAGTGRTFQPLSAFRYSDGRHSNMLTLTGVVCATEDVDDIRARFADWNFSNLRWRKNPVKIDVPTLSARERFHLQRYLPCPKSPARTLRRVLGHDIEKTRDKTLAQLKQYSTFYNYFPLFVRASP